MAKRVNTGVIVVGGVAALIIGYLLLKGKGTTTTPTSYVPTPQPATAQSQLLAWAGSQTNASTLTNLIKSLSVTDIVSMWESIFGGGNIKSSSTDYSGGGTDTSGSGSSDGWGTTTGDYSEVYA